MEGKRRRENRVFPCALNDQKHQTSTPVRRRKLHSPQLVLLFIHLRRVILFVYRQTRFTVPYTIRSVYMCNGVSFSIFHDFLPNSAHLSPFLQILQESTPKVCRWACPDWVWSTIFPTEGRPPCLDRLYQQGQTNQLLDIIHLARAVLPAPITIKAEYGALPLRRGHLDYKNPSITTTLCRNLQD